MLKQIQLCMHLKYLRPMPTQRTIILAIKIIAIKITNLAWTLSMERQAAQMLMRHRLATILAARQILVSLK
jgi:hypothetical protein